MDTNYLYYSFSFNLSEDTEYTVSFTFEELVGATDVIGFVYIPKN